MTAPTSNVPTVTRTSARRAPAEPTVTSQVARRARILGAAADLGASHGYDGVQMQEVARHAGVAVGTVYRYFPSKTQLFLAVMAEEVFNDKLLPEHTPGADPVTDVADILVGWTRRFTRRPGLALAMVSSTLAAYADTSADALGMDVRVAPLLLARLGVEEPAENELSRIRILLYAWWGIVIACLSEHMTQAEAEAHIRLAAALVFAAGPEPA